MKERYKVLIESISKEPDRDGSIREDLKEVVILNLRS